MTKHVAVLMGGWSREREVSLVSGKAITEALKTLGYLVTPLDVTPNVAADLMHIKPDVAFVAVHGTFGEDGCLQGVLEMLGIPYTHSGVLAGALSMDKPMAKKIFASEGLICPEGKVVTVEQLQKTDIMPRPYVIKPTNDGSSVGVKIVQKGDNILYDMGEPPDRLMLVERFIPGREISVAVMGNRALGAVEIRPRQGFYDYKAKYTEGQADHLVPAPLPPEAYAQVLAMALKAHQALGCRGVSRADFRYDDTISGKEQFYLLEVNANPGMTPLSLVPEIARSQGIEFPQLVEWLINEARCDQARTDVSCAA